ncbi:MAG: hypothetical protein ABI193_24965 [Minicystis sp.]
MIKPRLHRLHTASALAWFALTPLACTLSTAGIPGGVGGAGGENVCAPGDTRACFAAPAEKVGKGICKAGEHTCNNDGTWPAECPGQVLPLAKEICENTIDDDCNGVVNDTCGCIPGEIKSCYDGPLVTRDVGACKSGSHVCDAKGAAFGPCMGQTLPQAEDCASEADDDCDGAAPLCTGTPIFLTQGGTGPMPPDEDVGFAAAAGPENTFVFAGIKKAFVDISGYDPTAGALTLFKTGADGKMLWAQHLATNAGAGNHAVARGVAVGADGGIVVVGELAGHLDFAGATLKSASNSKDVLVAKLDKDGNQLWAKIFGDAQTQAALAVAIDGDENIYFTGAVSGNIDFGGTDHKGAVNDLFVVKLDKDGAHQWSGVFGDSVGQVGWSIAATPDGMVFLAGDLSGTLDLGGVMLTSTGGTDAFLARLDATTGGAIWGKRFGDGHDQSAYAVAVDPAGNVAITGVFRGFVDFGGGALANADPGDLTRDLFVARFDQAGTPLWSHRYGDARDQDAEAVALDGAGNVVITGSFLGTLAFEGKTLVNADANNLSTDLFVAKLGAAAGNVLWAQRFGDTAEQRGWGIAASANGNTGVTGSFKGTLEASPATTLVSMGDRDLFALGLAP